jgi:5-methylcytosine-specific restriction protein B
MMKAGRNRVSFADDVRQYCKENYIDPARGKGEKTVTIRSGDVHNALSYKDRYPLVCSAIGSNLFEELCNVRRISVEGPLNGVNTLFTFELI